MEPGLDAAKSVHWAPGVEVLWLLKIRQLFLPRQTWRVHNPGYSLPLLNEEKSQSNKTSPELINIKELPEKNIKIANTNICLMFSKLRLEKYILKALKFFDRETIISERKNKLDEINKRLDIAEETISDFKDIAIETIQTQTVKK